MKVLILGVTTRAGLSLLRKLAKDGVMVVGADIEPYPLGLHSRYSGQYHTYKCDTSLELITSLQEILIREKPDVLIPIKHSRELVEHREQIERYTRVLLPVRESYQVANDNYKTLEECHRLGIPSPRIYSIDEATKFIKQYKANESETKLVVKPMRDIGCSKGVKYVKTINELEQSIRDVEADFGDIVIQEYIPGEPHSMHAVNLLFDRDGKLISSFSYRKIRQYPMKGGLSVHFISVHERKCIDMVMPFFEKWKWQGPADVEYKIDARDNKAKIIEINPRYSGNIAFALSCGVDFHYLHCLAALSRPVNVDCVEDYEAGIKGVWLYYYLKSLVEEFRVDGKLWEIIKREIISIRGTRFDIRDNLVDFSPVLGLILRLFINRKGDV
jgi:predicted ATP-grasp superfamily ATP-dependent carboligase